MKGEYPKYGDLRAKEREGTDFEIVTREKEEATAAIIAIHAGGIEQKTGDIAHLIAGNDYSLYCFRGTKSANNRVLHITSDNFDEPECLKLISKHKRVISIHGCSDKGERVFIGGLDRELKDMLAAELSSAGIFVETSEHKFIGTNPENICNKGLSRRGVQIELTAGFRKSLYIAVFVNIVRKVLLEQNNPQMG